jgi:hypothetical protein
LSLAGRQELALVRPDEQENNLKYFGFSLIVHSLR